MASLLSRASFEAQLSIVRERENSGLVPWLLLVVLLFAVPFAVFHLMPSLEWRLVLYAEAAVALMLLLARLTRIRRFAREIGLVCPYYHNDLWGSGARYGPTVQETVLQQGLCPHCGARLLDPADVRRAPVQPPVSKARTVVGVVALVGLFVGFLLYGGRILRRAQDYRCADRYRAARTLSDTIHIDSMGSQLWKCRELRMRH
jgi:hypothetical protein